MEHLMRVPLACELAELRRRAGEVKVEPYSGTARNGRPTPI
jgi:hypothetical protein